MAQDFAAYDAVIADLVSKRDQLNGMIETLKQMMNLGLPLASATASAVLEPTMIPHDAFFGMKVPDAAKKYLSWGGSKNTKPHSELCDALLEGGFQTKSDNFPEVVRSTLGRSPEFVKIKGQWGLREWYPGHGGTKRARRGAQESQDETQSEPNIEPEEENDSKT